MRISDSALRCSAVAIVGAAGLLAFSASPAEAVEASATEWVLVDPSPPMPDDFAVFRQEPRSAVVLAKVCAVARSNDRSPAHKRINERFLIELQAIAWRGQESGAFTTAAPRSTIEIVPMRYGMLVPGQSYWLGLVRDDASSSYRLLKARIVAPERFDPEQYLTRYSARGDVALVACRVTSIQRPADHSGVFGRLDRYDFDRIDLAIEKVAWTQAPTTPIQPNTFEAIWRNPAERIANSTGDRRVRVSLRTRSGYDADSTPGRTSFQLDHRYWVVLAGGYYKTQAIPLAAIEIPGAGESEPRDIFARFQHEPAYALVIGKILDVSSIGDSADPRSGVTSERIRIEVSALPWGEDRARAIQPSLGGSLECLNAPKLDECERPCIGELRAGESYYFCMVKRSAKEVTRLVASYPK